MSRLKHGRREYQIESGRWVSRQRVNQLRSREKHRCRWYVTQARKRKLDPLLPKPCAVCGNKITESHHENYSRPFDIIWLCKKHHNQSRPHSLRGAAIQPPKTTTGAPRKIPGLLRFKSGSPEYQREYRRLKALSRRGT